MTLGDGTEASIEAAVAQLESRFEEVPVEHVQDVDDPEMFEHGLEVAEQNKLGGGGAWVEDDDGRVLFIRHPNSPDTWGLPGGGYEPGETLVETARREVREETGVEVRVTGVWKLTHRTVGHRDDPDRRFHVFDAWLEAEPVESAPEPDPDPADWEDHEEILAARWFAEPPPSVGEWFEERVAAWAADG
jgi:ADP-ribose pyrophosphatase YjhB (NUDIX family)